MSEKTNERAEPSASSYRFRFFRNLVNCCGVPVRSVIDRIEIRRARSPDRARQAALRRFERRHKPFSWRSLAHGCEREEPTGEDKRGGT